VTDRIDKSMHEEAWSRGRDLQFSLGSIPVIRTAMHFPTIDSTNALARELARQGEPGGLLILADTQTAGRGRLGRSFVSPSGGLWFTLLIRPQPGRSVAPATTLIAGTAVCEALRESGIDKAAIKWPNDILIGTRKAAGILAESGFDKNQQPYLVLGIGINLAVETFPPELSETATSVSQPGGPKVERIELLRRIIAHFADLSRKLDEEGFKAIRPRYLACSSTVGRDVLLVDPSQVAATSGISKMVNDSQPVFHCIDIAEDGSLVLTDAAGKIFKQNSGEISLRYPDPERKCT